VDLVEIDEEVLKVAQDHLPGNGKAFQDARVRIHIQDGFQFVRNITGLYDVILVDSTDPMGPGKVLYQSDFYRHCRGALREGGLFGAQALSAWIQQREQEAMFHNLREVWNHVLPYLVTVPTYPGALWTFALGSQRPLRPDAFDPAYAERISKLCRYYNPEVHRSAFCLPNFLKERLLNGGPRRH
jgi:spermidine synthase